MIDNPMFILLIIGVLSVFLIASYRKTRLVKKEDQEKYLHELDQQIAFKFSQLEELNNELENRRIDNRVHIPKVVNEVLDIYEESNIKIPADIIEDVSHMNMGNDKEVMDYIENQRLFWKLENTKKPYKKVRQNG